MNGLIALVGSGEYLPVMDEVDRHLLASVRHEARAPKVICLPTAAGQEGPQSVNRWMKMGEEHFSTLGAEVRALPIIDRDSAESTEHARELEDADLIYFSGGNPQYLYETMLGSRAWEAAARAWSQGAVYAGCSAGAMILGRLIPNFRRLGLGSVEGFGVVPAEYVMPHFDHEGPMRHYVRLVRAGMENGRTMVGIDENTALVGRLAGEWRALGAGRVHVLTKRTAKTFGAGEVVPMPRKVGA